MIRIRGKSGDGVDGDHLTSTVGGRRTGDHPGPVTMVEATTRRPSNHPALLVVVL
jgi:hypothetical protein